ncbi:hypothetical protein L195_g057624, partial [Trifolium pratense]
VEFVHLGDGKACKVQGMVEFLLHNASGTRRRRSTLALGYQMGDREESCIVAPKWYSYGDLVGYVSIVAEEGQNLEDLRGGN